MAHDWANDWMKPGTAVRFTLEGVERLGHVGLVSNDVRQAIVRFDEEGEEPGTTVEREVTLKREQLTRVED